MLALYKILVQHMVCRTWLCSVQVCAGVVWCPCVLCCGLVCIVWSDVGGIVGAVCGGMWVMHCVFWHDVLVVIVVPP